MLGIADKVVARARETLTGQETISGGEVLARILRAEGVDKVFGIIDGTYFGFYGTLGKTGIDLVSPRCEQSALHMAGAYARVTGRLGVAMASNGPGVAAALPGIAVEHTEGNRVLLITSARRHQIMNPDRGGTFQCFPHTEVIRPIANFSESVPSFERLPEIARHALRACFKGRPGVVHLDIPEDILNGKFVVTPGWELPPARYRATEAAHPAPAQVDAAAAMLLAAKRPFIHAGSGVVHAKAYAELAEVCELLHAPLTTSWGARCAVDERRPFAVPLTHIDLVTRVRNEGDCALILGSRLGETDWWGKAPYWRKASEQRAIQVDLDEQILGCNKPVDLAVVGCVRAFLQALAVKLRAAKSQVDVASRRAWIEQLLDARAADRAALEAKHLTDKASPLHPAHVATTCRKLFPDDAICVLDGGNTAVWGQFFFEVRAPGTLLGTPKMGMLGAGVSQALGAQVARPDKKVFCLIGDGAMGYHTQELETAVRNNLPVTWIVHCDKQWGMVKMGQSFALRPVKTLVKGSLDEGETINADFHEVDFAALARTHGAKGERVGDLAGLERAIEAAIAHDGPTVIHVDIDPVKHMWAPGLRAFKAMHEEPKG